MTENELNKKLVKELKKRVHGYEVDCFKNIYHSLTIDPQGNIRTDTSDDGKIARTGRAYQTDICVYEESGRNDVPRVVIELKKGSISTHQTVIYSENARKHKEVYPFLRYGLLLLGFNGDVPPRTVFHGAHFDFILATMDDYPSNNELEELLKIIEHESKMSLLLGDYLFDKSGRKRKHLFWKQLQIK
jgi:hypothetical protein